MPTALDESFAFCRRLTRREAGNFYFSFLTLPRARRGAMCAIYAWMRRLDDLADDAPSPAAAREAVGRWIADTRRALEGGEAASEPRLLWPAFAETAQRHAVPSAYFDGIAEGALMDQEITRYATFDDLYRYCYHVASLVGMVSLRVFGCADPRAERTGEWLGVAFQLTNILRDVREDAARGRIYLPREDLRRHGVAEEDILAGRWSDAMRALLAAFAERAEGYYHQAAPVADFVSPEARPTLRIMTEIYHGILEEIRRMEFRVFERRARVPTWKKLLIVLKHWIFSNAAGGASPQTGIFGSGSARVSRAEIGVPPISHETQIVGRDVQQDTRDARAPLKNPAEK